ncbi:MAG: myxococcus cysteine-rich repeat containing protein [Kofleriaceae bacterium]
MSRRYLIIASIAAHAILGAGLFISGIWKLERLDYKHRASLALGAMLPPGESGGGEGEKRDQEKKKEKKKKEKKEKTKVELRQVHKIEQDKPEEVAVDSTGGSGEGEGDGDGPEVGPGTSGGGGTCDPAVDPNQCQEAPVIHTQTCGDGILEAPEQCDDGNRADGDKCSSACRIEQILLPPGIFGAMRIAGDTQIVPPDTVKTQMLRDGKERTVGSFTLCIDAGGRVSSIAPITGGTKYPAYDAKITTAMRAWRYKPHSVSSQGRVSAVPACSVVTFVYTIK